MVTRTITNVNHLPLTCYCACDHYKTCDTKGRIFCAARDMFVEMYVRELWQRVVLALECIKTNRLNFTLIENNDKC